MRRASRVFLAGDYLGTLYTETADHHRLLRRPGGRQPARHRRQQGRHSKLSPAPPEQHQLNQATGT